MKATIVVGANYGDEGKGKIVDQLARKSPNSLVVRHNGGSQAAHTVQVNGHRHVFHHFGSGTFADSNTYLSSHFLCDPIRFREEHKKFELEPKMFVDINSEVVTPWDCILNQATTKGSTCGCGINETLTRIEDNPNLRLRVDMPLHDVRKIISEIALKYFSTEVMRRGLTIHQDDSLYIKAMGESFLDRFFDDFHFFQNNTEPAPALGYVLQINENIDHVIFEGAQGLMLNQTHKSFPFVTRSNTGVKNAMRMCADLDITDIEVVYVTRSYLTRHGAGPLPNEVEQANWKKPISHWFGVDETNIENDYQGKLRYARLQPFSMCEEIMHDIIPYRKDVKVTLAMTCLDQTPHHCYIDNNGFRVDFDPKEIVNLMNDLTCNLFHKFKFSYGPEANNRDDVTFMVRKGLNGN